MEKFLKTFFMILFFSSFLFSNNYFENIAEDNNQQNFYSYEGNNQIGTYDSRIFCIFKGSSQKEVCYSNLNTKCIGNEFCEMKINSKVGENIELKSTCSNELKRIQTGFDVKVIFNCKNMLENPIEITEIIDEEPVRIQPSRPVMIEVESDVYEPNRIQPSRPVMIEVESDVYVIDQDSYSVSVETMPRPIHSKPLIPENWISLPYSMRIDSLNNLQTLFILDSNQVEQKYGLEILRVRENAIELLVANKYTKETEIITLNQRKEINGLTVQLDGLRYIDNETFIATIRILRVTSGIEPIIPENWISLPYSMRIDSLNNLQTLFILDSNQVEQKYGLEILRVRENAIELLVMNPDGKELSILTLNQRKEINGLTVQLDGLRYIDNENFIATIRILRVTSGIEPIIIEPIIDEEDMVKQYIREINRSLKEINEHIARIYELLNILSSL